MIGNQDRNATAFLLEAAARCDAALAPTNGSPTLLPAMRALLAEIPNARSCKYGYASYELPEYDPACGYHNDVAPLITDVKRAMGERGSEVQG